MAAIPGILGLADSDRAYVGTVGQDVVYTTAQGMIERWNQEADKFMNLFVEATTENFKERYRLPGSGQLERRGPDSLPAAIKAGGSWDVAYPLEDFGAVIGGDDVSMAYMTLAEMNLHVQTVINRDINTVRFELLKALFNPNVRAFLDPLRGTLNVQPLANGDATLFPALQGSYADATANHYLATGYLASAISDVNNPFAVVSALLESRWGPMTGGSPIISFHNSAHNAKIMALTEFEPFPDFRVVMGTQNNYMAPYAVPANCPGKIIGVTSSCVNVQWDWIPVDYLLTLHMTAPKPLKMRVDLKDTGLPPGLNLVSVNDDKPLMHSFWRHRFGFGVGNRVSAVIQKFVVGSYAAPTIYA